FGLACGFALLRRLDAVVDGISQHVNEAGPQGRPTLGIQANGRARNFYFDLLSKTRGDAADLLGAMPKATFDWFQLELTYRLQNGFARWSALNGSLQCKLILS